MWLRTIAFNPNTIFQKRIKTVKTNKNKVGDTLITEIAIVIQITLTRPSEVFKKVNSFPFTNSYHHRFSCEKRKDLKEVRFF